MPVTDSHPTLGMDKITSGPETLFPPPHCLARQSFIRSFGIGAAAIMLVFSASGQLAQAADGDLDPTFGTGGQVMIDFNNSTDIAYAVALQSDGKLVVAGTTYINNDYTGEDFAITRHNANGTLDTTFGVDGKVTTDFPGLAAVASSVVVQPDGKILVAGGAFPGFTFAGDFKLVRYNPDGSLDTSFGAGGIVTTSFPGQGSYAFALTLQSDGKIIAAGTDFVNFSTNDSSNTDFALERYNPDGTPDTTFGNGGQVTTDFDGFNDDVFSVLVQPDGEIIAVGSAKNPANFYDFAAVRYLANGTIDTSFGTGGKVRTDFGATFDRARSAALQPDGKIVAAGTTIFNKCCSQDFAVVRYNSDGTLDTTFDSDGKVLIDFGSFDQTAYRVFLQPDGKIVTVGYPDTESSDSDFLLARCNTDGSLDTTFGVGGKVRTSFGDLNGGAYGAVLQPDGKIVAVGFQATFTDQWAEFALARYLGSSAATPTPTPTPTSTPTPTPTPTPTATSTPTPANTPTPTPTATPTPTPAATPTPTTTPTSTPAGTPTPTPTPGAQAVNLSTRMLVQTGDNVGIGGFIITGTAPKHVLLRAIGPSLTQSGVPDALADPVLELHGPGAFVTITNDNWRDDPVQEAAILATGIPPTNDLESAIDMTLNPGAYTAVVRGKDNTSGVALVEVYDLSQAVPAKLANISTRAFVSTGDNIVIAGFMLGSNSGDDRIVVRGIGPSLAAVGVTNALADPTLELRDGNGAILIVNNDWQDDPAQAAELTAAGLAPTNNLESGIAATLPPGPYTALLTGLNDGTGVGLVEVYDRGAP
jgi:uncharacterized delta-60 repeat protein